MRILRRLLLLAVFGAVLVLGWKFASVNSQTVSVHYVFGEIPDVPLWAVLLASFGSGAVVAGVLSFYELIRQGWIARRYRKTARELESEIHQMRNLPLVGSSPDAEPNEIAAAEPADQAERSA